jgi:dTDP-4-dehydrorhamnose 3,5-epimerase
MSELFIKGVTFEPRRVFPDKRGEVRKFVTADEDGWIDEVYFSLVRYNTIKGYHLHKRMTLRYTCVVGEVLVGLADARPKSRTFGRTMVWPLADHEPYHGVLTVPPGVWNAFRIALHKEISYGTCGSALICNAASMKYSPTEILRADVKDIGIEILGPQFQLSG